ncbi:Asp23/Gls24 family envelope stress response protein [Paludicola sp. MB14-C6]|uniref:Asp23/Gls24 family envelope stress response protein n=1 Tax=Paludihabitans sp. MB14-C6 TaxID=3070656 RepID=UPI0027DD085E|nr:Asp23/Gls24 family envelope stress response protein [Paludicola sp. MB14-C6]WMJ21995.1 Asp23/Gls24 family envelope stress response protein [Paludicola sp. MB14-C6]
MYDTYLCEAALLKAKISIASKEMSFMVKLENHLGVIDVSHEYFVNLVGSAVISCFGVAAMATADATQGFLQKFKRNDNLDKGIRVRVKNQKLVIDLHIIVTYGTNISAIVKSIMHKVQYTVEENTGFSVARVNVFVDGMKTV